MPYTEFYCDASAGSNLNAGSSSGAPTVTYTGGDWVQSTRVFTVASGDPVADGVNVGDFVSVYADGAAAPTGFVGRVTARTTTTITVSATASSGTSPADGTGNRTLKVGGAWAGPTGASGFPFGFITSAATDSSANPVRVNFKNNAAYAITAAMTHNGSSITFQGYGSSPGDGGRATFDGGTGGASYVLLSNATNPNHFADLVFANNGATGSSAGVSCSVGSVWERCVFRDVRGAGITMSSGVVLIECEATGCNQSNTASVGGFTVTSSSAGLFVRCVSHNNSGSNACGFVLQGNNGGGHPTLVGCVADTNGAHGFLANATGFYALIGCVAYNNGADGFRSSGATSYHYVENSIFDGNGVSTGTGYGVNQSVASSVFPQRQANTGFFGNQTGQTNNVNAAFKTGDISFSAAPMQDAANGNFGPASAQAQGAGRGSFTQTTGYAATSTSRPDVGAVQLAGGSASAVFASRQGVGRLHYRPTVTRKVPTAMPVSPPRVQVVVPTVKTRIVPRPVRLPDRRVLVQGPPLRSLIVAPGRRQVAVVRPPARLRQVPLIQTVVVPQPMPLPGRRVPVSRPYPVRRAPQVFPSPIVHTTLVISPQRVVR